MYSPYPFPWRGSVGGFKDQFSKDAWEALSQNPEKPFYRFEDHKGRRSLRYATADVMRESCISCHNSHPQTPKSNWKLGDVRGVLEVVHPVDRVEANTKNGLENTLYAATALSGFGIFCLTILIQRLRKDAFELKEAQDTLENKIVERTSDLQKAYEDLEDESQQREKMQSDLLQSEKLASVGQLAGGIAHEINTPVQYIGDNLRFLNEEQVKILEVLEGCSEEIKEKIDYEFLKEEIPSSINQSIQGVEHVAKLVRSMKEFAHPGSNELKLTDINRVIENVVVVSKNEWKYVAEIEFELDKDLPQIPCLLGEFNQVLLNIIVNAAHAIEEKNQGTEDKGSITLTTKLLEDVVEIRIKDTGTGIPKEVQEKIFDPFFTTKEVGKGTGQGLSIAYKLVTEKLAGTVNVESEVGKGTTFAIALPASVELKNKEK